MKRTRVGHWLYDDCDVYVGRDQGTRHLINVVSPHTRGSLGNPFTVEEYGREEAIRRFRQSFEYQMENNPELREYVKGLSGRVLGCWCRRLGSTEPPCHADVIAEWADKIAEQEVQA